MALLSTGERENAPGAQRRETAHVKRELAKSLEEEAEWANKNRDINNHNAHVYENRAALANSLPADLRFEGNPNFRTQQIVSEERAHQLALEAERLHKEAGKLRRSALWDSVVAICQTVAAKIGIHI